MSVRYPVPQFSRPRAGLPGLWNTPLLTAGDATVDGQTLTAVASLIAGSATGSSPNATVNGQTLTATASLIAGAATGERFATVNGQTLTATASLIAGAATGSSPDATVAGVTLSVLASLSAGGASSSNAGRRDVEPMGLQVSVCL